MRINRFSPVFVDRIPKELKAEELYVCMACNVVVHLCPCGCNEKVVLPIGRDQWVLTYDGEGITMSPSIGNFQFPCESHYYIRNNNVKWLEDNDDDCNYNKKPTLSLLEKIKKLFKI
ncbi:MAG: hypothetical protein J5964_08030 [Eubacterium sp.]|nr:hypothetical protein [Eubacterium sp.]